MLEKIRVNVPKFPSKLYDTDIPKYAIGFIEHQKKYGYYKDTDWSMSTFSSKEELDEELELIKEIYSEVKKPYRSKFKIILSTEEVEKFIEDQGGGFWYESKYIFDKYGIKRDLMTGKYYKLKESLVYDKDHYDYGYIIVDYENNSIDFSNAGLENTIQINQYAQFIKDPGNRRKDKFTKLNPGYKFNNKNLGGSYEVYEIIDDFIADDNGHYIKLYYYDMLFRKPEELGSRQWKDKFEYSGWLDFRWGSGENAETKPDLVMHKKKKKKLPGIKGDYYSSLDDQEVRDKHERLHW